MPKSYAYASALVNGICRKAPNSETHRIVLLETNPGSDGTGWDLCDNYSPIPPGSTGTTYCNTNYFATAATTGSIANTTAVTFLFSGDETAVGVAVLDIANSYLTHYEPFAGGGKVMASGETLRFDISAFSLQET